MLQGASTECQPTALALKTHAHRRCQLRFFPTHAQFLSSFYFSTAMQAHSQTPRHTHRQTNTCEEQQTDKQKDKNAHKHTGRQTDKQTNGPMSIEGQWKVVTEMFANGV